MLEQGEGHVVNTASEAWIFAGLGLATTAVEPLPCTATVNAVAAPDPFTAVVPSAVAPSSKVTVPVAVKPPVQVTFAVRVTDWPAVDGLVEDVSAVDVEYVKLIVTAGVAVTPCVVVCEVAPEVTKSVPPPPGQSPALPPAAPLPRR